MEEQKDLFQISKNFTAIAIFILIVLVVIDIALRFNPEVFKSGNGAPSAISSVGHEYKFDNGSSYYIYTIFESDGDVYQCWSDGKMWNQKKVANYKDQTINQD